MQICARYNPFFIEVALKLKLDPSLNLDAGDQPVFLGGSLQLYVHQILVHFLLKIGK